VPLLGKAAMLLAFDIVQEAIPEHDDWHTHEHLPERLSIPGFVRGTRWVALRGQPRYFVMYEVTQLTILTSEAYLDRLNNPSPWTSKMMPHYRGMTRGFCSVVGSFGLGIGHLIQLLRFKPETGAESSLRRWLLQDALPQLCSRPGIGSVHLLEGTLTPTMTTEQRIRGTDSRVDWALLLTGYSQDALAALAQTEVGGTHLERHGATGVLDALYRMDYSLSHEEPDA
jgi:hypothetical protein